MTEQLMKKICREKGFRYRYSTEKHDREDKALLFKLFTFDAYYYQFVFYLTQFDSEEDLKNKLDEIRNEYTLNQNMRREDELYPTTLKERQKDESWLRQIGEVWFHQGWPKVTEERLNYFYENKIWFPTREDFRDI